MAPTRALLSVRLRDGSTVYVNGQREADRYLDGLLALQSSEAFQQPQDEIAGRLGVIEAGLRVQAGLLAEGTPACLSSAIASLRQLNRAVGEAKHLFQGGETSKDKDRGKAVAADPDIELLSKTIYQTVEQPPEHDEKERADIKETFNPEPAALKERAKADSDIELPVQMRAGIKATVDSKPTDFLDENPADIKATVDSKPAVCMDPKAEQRKAADHIKKQMQEMSAMVFERAKAAGLRPNPPPKGG